VLSLLLTLEIETRESAEVLLTNCLIDCGTPPDSLAIVVGSIGPPVCLGFNIPEDHVFYSCRQSRNFPWNICFPASPGLAEVLEDSLGLVCLNSLRHHVVNIHNDCCSQLEIVL